MACCVVYGFGFWSLRTLGFQRFSIDSERICIQGLRLENHVCAQQKLVLYYPYEYQGPGCCLWFQLEEGARLWHNHKPYTVYIHSDIFESETKPCHVQHIGILLNKERNTLLLH